MKKYNRIIREYADIQLETWAQVILEPIAELGCPGQVSYYMPTHTYQTVKRLQDKIKADLKRRREQLQNYMRIIKKFENIQRKEKRELTEREQFQLDQARNQYDRLQLRIHWMKTSANRPKPMPHTLLFEGSPEDVIKLTQCYHRMFGFWQKIIYEKYFVGGCRTDNDLAKRLNVRNDLLCREIQQLSTYICGALQKNLAA